jgi:dynein heavy chain
MVGSGGGKTSDEIVYELAENILGKLRDSLDMDSANKALFEVTIKHYKKLCCTCRFGK